MSLVGHHIWPWLTGHERYQLAIVVPPLKPYAILRIQLPWAPLHLLRLPRDRPDHAALLIHQRSKLLGQALIAFDFNYGDLVG
jgi:hypothetical protein